MVTIRKSLLKEIKQGVLNGASICSVQHQRHIIKLNIACTLMRATLKKSQEDCSVEMSNLLNKKIQENGGTCIGCMFDFVRYGSISDRDFLDQFKALNIQFTDD